jgi:hypothetical protein
MTSAKPLFCPATVPCEPQPRTSAAPQPHRLPSTVAKQCAPHYAAYSWPHLSRCCAANLSHDARARHFAQYAWHAAEPKMRPHADLCDSQGPRVTQRLRESHGLAANGRVATRISYRSDCNLLAEQVTRPQHRDFDQLFSAVPLCCAALEQPRG